MKNKGKNIGVWLSGERLEKFLDHVPEGNRSDWGADAIEDKLRREGAYLPEAGAECLAILKRLDPGVLSLLLEFAEVLREQPEAAKSALSDLKSAALAAEGGAR